MNSLKRPVAAFLLLVLALLFTGCITSTRQDSSIPWSRPASWESQVPGMSATPGGNGH